MKIKCTFFNKPEWVYLITVLIFGIFSSILTFPLSNGDEGFHLAKSYEMFSKTKPESTSEDTLRSLELNAVGISGNIADFNIKSFYGDKLSDVENDTVKFNFLFDNNLILKFDIGHLIPAIGVLLGRAIYPSYGCMLFFARILNLIFFSISMFYIIKISEVGKWSLFMLFSVPYIQKLASPSYDVFCYITFSLFAITLLTISKKNKINDITIKEKKQLILSMALLLFTKNNYIFCLFLLFFIPSVTHFFKHKFTKYKIPIMISSFLIVIVLFVISNYYFNLTQFLKVFFYNYFNIETMGRRSKLLFTITPTILPEYINILWIIIVVQVMICERQFNWSNSFITGCIITFFVNWFGIYTGFYLIHGKNNIPFDDLSGRYLHPYIIFFLPFFQKIGYNNKLTIPNKKIAKISFLSTITIFILYLIIVTYRGFYLHVTPTWSN